MENDVLFMDFQNAILEEVNKKIVSYALDHDMSISDTINTPLFMEELAEHMHDFFENSHETYGSISEDSTKTEVENYMSFLSESEKEDDDDDDDDEIDETVFTKHGISKADSIKARKEYAHNFKLKKKRKLYQKKIDSRGGRPLDFQMAKQKTRAQRKSKLGKRWEEACVNSIKEADKEGESAAPKNKDAQDKDCNCGKKDCKVCNPPKEESCNKKNCDESVIFDALKENLSNTVNVEKEVIKESINDSMTKIGNLGNLNEDDSNSIKETIEKVILEQIESRSNILVEHLSKIAANLISNKLLDECEAMLEDTIQNEVIPSINNDIDGYLNYVAENMATSLYNDKLIVKSKQSTMLEDFTDSLLDLIKDKLNILPEQEDATIALEKTNKALQESLDTSRRERIKTRNALMEATKKIFVLENLPNNLSENRKEQILNQAKLINEDDFDAFKSKALKVISGEYKPEQTEVNEETKQNVQSKKERDEEERRNYFSNIAKQALRLA